MVNVFWLLILILFFRADHLKEIGAEKTERLMILEQWLEFEKKINDEVKLEKSRLVKKKIEHRLIYAMSNHKCRDELRNVGSSPLKQGRGF